MVGYLAILTKGHKNAIITLFKCKKYALTSRNFSEITSHFKEIQGIFRAKSKKFELCVVETLVRKYSQVYVVIWQTLIKGTN